jgi:AraC-like DNA-binding protein
MSCHANPAPQVAITELLNQVRARALADRRIALVSETIQNNLALDLSPEELARPVNLSESRLRHRFKEVTGMSLARYIKLSRMERAAHLLATEFLTVKVVLSRVGINEKSHFERDFKALYGATPARYRNYPLNRENRSEPHAEGVNGVGKVRCDLPSDHGRRVQLGAVAG